MQYTCTSEPSLCNSKEQHRKVQIGSSQVLNQTTHTDNHLFHEAEHHQAWEATKETQHRYACSLPPFFSLQDQHSWDTVRALPFRCKLNPVLWEPDQLPHTIQPVTSCSVMIQFLFLSHTGLAEPKTVSSFSTKEVTQSPWDKKTPQWPCWPWSTDLLQCFLISLHSLSNHTYPGFVFWFPILMVRFAIFCQGQQMRYSSFLYSNLCCLFQGTTCCNQGNL